jgi:hypothetical protein
MPNISGWLKGLFVLVLCAAAFGGGVLWQLSVELEPAAEPCASGAQSPSYQILSAQLREFDDGLALAINMPRDLVVEQVTQLQSIRRETEQLPVPVCVAAIKARMVAYMNQVVDLLVAFVGGTPPDLVLQALRDSDGLRDAMEGEMAQVIGIQVTPYPTSYQFQIPVTGAGDVIETTPTTESGMVATVTNAQGANLRESPNAESALLFSLPPETQVSLFGVSEDGLWVYVQVSEDLSGWLYISLITIDGEIDKLPVIE